MRTLLLSLGLLAFVLTGCKSKEERTTNWVLKDEAVWLVIQTDYTYEAVTQSVVTDTGVAVNNGVFQFTSGTEGNYELILPFLTEVLISDFLWNVEVDTVRGVNTEQAPDPLGGTAAMAFKAYEISKRQMRLKMLYTYTAPDLVETMDMELNLQRRR